MDWAMDSATKIPAYRTASVLGLLACVVVPGCARLNGMIRDEPAVLGVPSAPISDARAGSAGSPGTRVVASRPARPPDLYAENLRKNRTDLSEDKVPGARAKTELAAISETRNSPDVVLTPPVSLSLGGSTRETATSLVEPTQVPHSATTTESLVAEARSRLDSMSAYQVDMNRQERVGETLQEAEDVVLSIRRDPRAVRLEWREGAHKGREVLFAEKETRGLMQINMADSKIPMPRLSLPPDSPLVARTSRHPITEAGFDTIVGNLARTIQENRAGDQSHGQIVYAGLEQPDPVDHPCHKVVRTTANGETWLVYLDPESKLPAMVQANAANGDLLERYLFHAIRADPPELAATEAFDPTARWGESKGLFGRIAIAPGAQSGANSVTR